ncbi:MAG: hypothetical protein KF746_26050 [Chitinophagaceae bacterium]|nr:hypothetical protein [Chitinophagaceae bacterium]
MLQISRYLSPAIAITHEELLADYLSENTYKPAVPAIEQQAVLQHLDKEIPREHIYFTISLTENRIVHCNGVARWLGYADADFSLRDYQEIIHPTHAAIQGYYSMALLELFRHNEISLQFMQPVCATIIALKHKTGKYIYCKRECAPFQLTEGSRMTEYLCYFHVIKEFSNENYHTRLYRGNEQGIYTEERLHAFARKKFAEYTDFSIQELRILKRHARQKDSTSKTIGKAFKIEKSTVDTFNKRILKKAEIFSGQNFKTAKEAALYFKHAGLI